MPKKIKIPSISTDTLPSVKDFQKHFGGNTDFGMIGGSIPGGQAILKGTDFLASIFGMKTPLEKEDQAELNKLIEQKKEAAQLAQDKALGRDMQERLTNMKLNFAKSEGAATRAQLASQAAAELRENKRYHDNAAPSRIWKILQGVLEPFWRNAAPYVVLGIVLIVLVLALKGGLGFGSKGKSGGKPSSFGNPIAALRRAASGVSRAASGAKRKLVEKEHYIIRKIKQLFQKIAKFFQKLFHPLYKVKQFTNIVSGGAHDTGFDRTKIESGRCDNMKWVETTAEGAKGQCDNTVHPIDLTWKLDNTKTPEYFDLPQVRKAQLDKYSTVKIPWDVNPEASFYVPQCEKAYYPQTCKSNGICEKADMFEDLGLSCRPKDDKLPTQYPGAEGQTVTSFDDNGIKKCIDIHTLADVPCQ
jgi:hypothetical protein